MQNHHYGSTGVVSVAYFTVSILCKCVTSGSGYRAINVHALVCMCEKERCYGNVSHPAVISQKNVHTNKW